MSLNLIVDVMMIEDFSATVQRRSECHQSNYCFAWEYVRSELQSFFDKRIASMRRHRYIDIPIIKAHWIELLQLKFEPGKKLNLNRDLYRKQDQDEQYDALAEFRDVADDEFSNNTIDALVHQLEESHRRSSRLCDHALLKQIAVHPGEKWCDFNCQRGAIDSGIAWHCANGYDFDLCNACCPRERRFREPLNDEKADEDAEDTSVLSALKAETGRYILFYETCS